MLYQQIYQVQKRHILEFIKGITNDLVHNKKLRLPLKVEDKVFYSACHNLWNAVSDTVDESKNLKKKNKDLHCKIDDLTRTVNSLEDQLRRCNEAVKKLRLDVDVKESSGRILEQELEQWKESYKTNDTKLTCNLKEYDDLTSELKSQIVVLEQRNNKLNGIVEHLQEKVMRGKVEIENEKERLNQTQSSFEKNIRIYEKTVQKLSKQVHLDEKKIKEARDQDRVTNRLLKSLSKVEKLQDCLDDKMKELEENVEKSGKCNKEIAIAHLYDSSHAHGKAMSLIPVPIYTCTNSHCDRSFVGQDSFETDQSPPSSETLPNSYISIKTAGVKNPEVVHHHHHRASKSNQHQFCNIKQHTKMSNNLQALRNTLLQGKSRKLEEVGDAKKRNGLYQNANGYR